MYALKVGNLFKEKCGLKERYGKMFHMRNHSLTLELKNCQQHFHLLVRGTK